MDECPSSENDLDLEKDKDAKNYVQKDCESTDDVETDNKTCVSPKNELLLEDYNTSDDETQIEVNRSSKTDQSDSSFTTSPPTNKTVDGDCAQDVDNHSKERNKLLESGKNCVNKSATSDEVPVDEHSDNVFEMTPLEQFCDESDAVVTANDNGVKGHESVQLKVVNKLDTHANKENIILVRRTTKNGEVNSSRMHIDNLSKQRSGTPFVQYPGSVNSNILLNCVTNELKSKGLNDLEDMKDSGKCLRSDSKRTNGNMRKLPISSRVELMLSNDLFKKYVGKHQGLLERISQRQGRGRQSGLKKTFSNLDLSNLDLEQEFNSPFTPSYEKQQETKDQVCEKSASFTSGDTKMKDLRNHEPKRRLSLAADKDLLDLQNELDRREQLIKDAERESMFQGSNRKFKFCIPSFEDFKRSRKEKLISGQKFVKNVLTNDKKTKAVFSQLESKVQSVLETENNERVRNLENSLLETLTENENSEQISKSMPFEVLPSETLPFEVSKSELLEEDLESEETTDREQQDDKTEKETKLTVEADGALQGDCIGTQPVSETDNKIQSAIQGDISGENSVILTSNETQNDTNTLTEPSIIEKECGHQEDSVEGIIGSSSSGGNSESQNKDLENQDATGISIAQSDCGAQIIPDSDKSDNESVLQENKHNDVMENIEIVQDSLNSSTSSIKVPSLPETLPPTLPPKAPIPSPRSKLPVRVPSTSSQKSSQNSPRLSQNSCDKSPDISLSANVNNPSSSNVKSNTNERVILRASRKRKNSSRKSESRTSKKLSQSNLSRSVSESTATPEGAEMNSVKTNAKIPLLSLRSISSDSDVFPEKSPCLSGSFIFNENSESLSNYSATSGLQNKGDNSNFSVNIPQFNFGVFDHDSVDIRTGINREHVDRTDLKKSWLENVKYRFVAENDPESLKNSVMRSTSDVTDSTPEANRKRRERRERPYKSDPFTGVPKLPASRLLSVSGKPRSSSSLKEDYLDFNEDTSLEEFNEEGDSLVSENDSERGQKMRNRLSNLSNASSDSGVNGLPDIPCDLPLSPNSSETSLYNLFNSPDNLKKDYEDGDDMYKGRRISDGFMGPDCSLCKQTRQSHTDQTLKQWNFCIKCSQKLSERKEAITEIKDTEISYGRDLKILREEFYKPMRSAGLLSAEQLESIFLNLEELIAVNKQFTEKLEKAVLSAEQNGHQNLLTVNIGHLFMESTSLILAFDNYCVNQGHASILLEQLEKEKEILRIFLKVSQDENSLLRRMHLKSFLMVPVQRITRYPLLLDRIHKLTPDGHMDKDTIVEAKSKIEDILGHINAKTKQGGTLKIKRKNAENYKITVTEKLEVNKTAIDVLGWNKKEVCDIITSRLLVASQSEQNWASRKVKSLKFTQVHGVLLTLGQGEVCQRSDERLLFPKKSEVIQAAVVLIKEKNGRYQPFREPFMLNRCVVNIDPDTVETFELMELNKEPLLFKGEDNIDTKVWLQNVKQQTLDLGTWRRRRNALPNIMMKHIV